MRVVPFDPTSVTRFAVLTLVPMLPLVLTEIPLGDLLRMIGKLVVGHVD